MRKTRYDSRRQKARLYLGGDLVLVARTLRFPHLTQNLLPKYIGPFHVVRRLSSVNCLVEDLPAARRKKIWRRFPTHVSQMKIFRTPQELDWKPIRSDKQPKTNKRTTKKTTKTRELVPYQSKHYTKY